MDILKHSVDQLYKAPHKRNRLPSAPAPQPPVQTFAKTSIADETSDRSSRVPSVYTQHSRVGPERSEKSVKGMLSNIVSGFVF